MLYPISCLACPINTMDSNVETKQADIAVGPKKKKRDARLLERR